MWQIAITTTACWPCDLVVLLT